MRPKDNQKKTYVILKQDCVSPFFSSSVEYIEFSQAKEKDRHKSINITVTKPDKLIHHYQSRWYGKNPPCYCPQAFKSEENLTK